MGLFKRFDKFGTSKELRWPNIWVNIVRSSEAQLNVAAYCKLSA